MAGTATNDALRADLNKDVVAITSNIDTDSSKVHKYRKKNVRIVCSAYFLLHLL